MSSWAPGALSSAAMPPPTHDRAPRAGSGVLRILRARIPEPDLAAVVAGVRSRVITEALGSPGLLSIQPGIRRAGGEWELVVASTWESLDALPARGRDLDRPLGALADDPLVADGRADHFELVVGGSRHLPLRGRCLRISDAALKPRMEAAYFEQARSMVGRLMDEPGVIAFDIARRIVDGANHAVAVSVWEDRRALDRLLASESDALVGRAATAGHLAGPPAVEHFDALRASDSASSGPAVLVADDEGRYLFANRAAEVLTGHPIARLLTMRVADLVAADRETVESHWRRFVGGESNGQRVALARADGSIREVHIATAANTPWPGAHSCVLGPSVRSLRAGLDAALAMAGLLPGSPISPSARAAPQPS